MKTCSKCGETKPTKAFHDDRHAKDGFKHFCKECSSAARKLSYIANKKRENRQATEWKKANPCKAVAICRKFFLKRLYGLEVEDFEQIRLNQQNRCAICKEAFQKTPHVDHDHATGKVRGLLCHACNVSLGGFKDSPSRLIAAAAYLQKDALTPHPK